jgi:competence protein ComEA
MIYCIELPKLQIVSLLFVIMKLNKEPIKDWFGYTRRERRSTFIMLIIIILIIGLRYLIPVSSTAIEDITAKVSVLNSHAEPSGENISTVGTLFSFDPNTASYDTLIKLGLAEKEANTLISYRNKGGKFRQPSDIKKVYGVEGVKAEMLIPFIKVRKTTSEKFRSRSPEPQKSIIDVNICDSATLVSLPGIGPVLSARIIKYRRLLGGFARIEQLKEVYGLPAETFELIKGRIFADSSAITRININSAGYKELSRLPYIEKFEVTAILKYRELRGIFKGIADLTENKLITNEKVAKIRPYLRFDL